MLCVGCDPLSEIKEPEHFNDPLKFFVSILSGNPDHEGFQRKEKENCFVCSAAIFLACSAGVFVVSESSIFLRDGKCVANILRKVGERKKFLPRR